MMTESRTPQKDIVAFPLRPDACSLDAVLLLHRALWGSRGWGQRQESPAKPVRVRPSGSCPRAAGVGQRRIQ